MQCVQTNNSLCTVLIINSSVVSYGEAVTITAVIVEATVPGVDFFCQRNVNHMDSYAKEEYLFVYKLMLASDSF